MKMVQMLETQRILKMLPGAQAEDNHFDRLVTFFIE
jgi:hypothetical protein